MKRLGTVGPLVVGLVLALLICASAFGASPSTRAPGGTVSSPGTLVPAISVIKTLTVGKDPTAVVLDPATHEVYVANERSNSVSVINATTNTVVKTIRVGLQPTTLLYNPSNKDLYVENFGSSNYSVISTADKVVSTVKIQGSLTGAAPLYDPANGDVYGLSTGFVPPATFYYNVSKVDKTTQVVTTIHVAAGAYDMAYDNASKCVVVSDSTSGKLSVVNSSTNAVTTVTLPAGLDPAFSIYNPASKDLYILDLGITSKGQTPTGNVTVLRPNNTVAATIKVGAFPVFAFLDPANHDVYVSDWGVQNKTTHAYPKSTVSVISTANKVVATLHVGVQPGELAYSPKTLDIYIPCQGSNKTYVVNASTNKWTGTNLTVKQYPFIAVYDPGNGDVLVVGDSNATGTPVKTNATVISSTNKVVATLIFGLGPAGGYVYDAATKTGFVSNSGAGTVSLVF